ncbi:hypothetical protein AMECASPLE_036730 [Ameca splendens]|uniref:Uncharacterized protein n=1 Tax=Ameca splendens TaxID=208324 RepID=A0ABV0XWQ3_9TELE
MLPDQFLADRDPPPPRRGERHGNHPAATQQKSHGAAATSPQVPMAAVYARADPAMDHTHIRPLQRQTTIDVVHSLTLPIYTLYSLVQVPIPAPGPSRWSPSLRGFIIIFD